MIIRYTRHRADRRVRRHYIGYYHQCRDTRGHRDRLLRESEIKKAEHNSLKRAAAKFGVARKLYRDEERIRDPEQNDDGDSHHPAQICDPLAKTAGDLISLKQLLLINTLAKRAQIDPVILCRDACKAGLGEISQRAAFALINHLQTLVLPITQ